ncbi:A disintegrin and metalloproteinase with thrombospondin motifs 12-like [Zootermopsis nevadensis]|uniref:A disintegrin and metalloproteinase with thrombospondin motifs 12-like n=1 Tax=Zootermopsis nevadensis TaxID=136037 RepID=UPI000B8E29B1|nr:A disintegrin and metalloproteinase with thrombospondin motifs 12-like [Zootermopsis nevadensis]
MQVSLLVTCIIIKLLVRNVLCFGPEDSPWENREYNGRHTKNIKGQVVVPRKVNQDSEFLSYSLPHFYERDTNRRRKREVPDESDKVHYGLTFNGMHHHVELWPNHDFVSPGMMVEERSPGANLDINKTKIRPANTTQCHYIGRVKGHNDSRLALSVCDGMSGYIKTNHGHYFIEPMEGHQPEEDGQHLHVVHKRSVSEHKTCGTGGWEQGWRDRLRLEHRRVRAVNGTVSSKHRYLELLVVADRKFLNHHNHTDVENYILTIMNMASNLYHDASAGNLIDIVVVRIIYLHKQEEEMDLHINQDADKTLKSFCKWQASVNPQDVTHPNHHDIAVMLTRFDICTSNMTECELLGLAHVAQACNPNMSCAICEDSGLVLGVTVAHEVGHVMGCGHDDGVDSECQPMADEVNAHVMSPFVQMATANWSTCSKKFMQEFLDSGLGDCLLDEPQAHNFKFPEMPPGAMYDANFQCGQEFQNPDVVSCDMGPEKNCKALYCEYKPKKCASHMQPPADGTKCGINKWCYNQKCVPVGQRPEAKNGGWGAWTPWSECSRSCGGGVSFMERDCNNPAPENHGRYCLGERRKYRICNTKPCNPEDATFREQQCSQYDDAETHLTPFLSTEPQEVCKLLCMNKEGAITMMSPRAKDGTPCRPGTKDLCIAGMCRVVGCDWILGSEAVEDRCGVCKGEGKECTIVEETFKENGSGYVKIATIPTGSRRISIEELGPSDNMLALKVGDNKTFHLNGDYSEEGDRELHVAGTVGYYFHPEEDREKIVISGPTKNQIILYACFFDDPNPGITYKYAVQSHNKREASTYQPQYQWEFVGWNECNRQCGGGTQESEPKCVEERDGVVSNSFCPLADKPKTTSRSCNQRPCKARWRVGQWGECSGCMFKTGHKIRKVDCIRESPFEDEEIMTDDADCTEKKPHDMSLCNNLKPCENINGNRLPRESKSEKNRTPYKKQQNGLIVIDRAPPHMFKTTEVPLPEKKSLRRSE